YRLTVMAGDRMREQVFDRYEGLFGCLVQLYGSTEMGAIAVSNPEDPRPLREQTVGKPLSNVQLRLDKTAGEQELGELWCRHAHGSSGYVDDGGRPVVHTELGGWYPTRDLGRIRPDGLLQVLGRMDHSVNRSGLLVLFTDVEKALATIDGVESAAVVASGESQYGKGLVAFCVLRPGGSLTGSEIRSISFARLPKRAIPDVVRVIPALPLLPNGKLDRQALIRSVDEV
ncbi:MAG: class I adenylate-forming enzyme family protein, partial [Methylococcaceae bacterium]|nr:class I adenylate-forming enzyme family protein [Methylococcaceae bacterium]